MLYTVVLFPTPWEEVTLFLRSTFSHLSLSVLSPSTPGGHLECDRSLAGERPEQLGSQHRTERGSPGSCDFNHLLPAQQTDANDPSDQRGAVHQLAAQLPASGLRSVSLPFLPLLPAAERILLPPEISLEINWAGSILSHIMSMWIVLTREIT